MQKAIRRRIVHPTSKGQVTLPVTVRRALNIRPETALDVSVEDGRVVLEPVRQYTDREIAQFLKEDQLDPKEAQFWKTIIDFQEIAPEGVPLATVQDRLKQWTRSKKRSAN